MHIAIAIYDRLTALDAIGPYEVLSRVPDATVTFVAERRGEHRTDVGSLGLMADAAFDELPAPDVVLVPGGPHVDDLVGTAIVDWIAAAHRTSTWTTSVCTGALLLGAAGVLDGLPATTHWRRMDRLAELGAVPRTERVVRAGKVMTAAGVSAGIDMALTLAAELAGDVVAQAIQLGIEYDPQPPFDTGSLAKAGPDLAGVVRAAMT